VQREVTALENLSHPTLARLIEQGYCDVAGKHTRYIAYEFIEGQTLSQLLKGGPLLEYEVLPIARDVAAGIAAIWSRGIVHGDIKPSNIMLRDSGNAVLIDLGAARYLEDDAAPKSLRPVSYFSRERVRQSKPLGTMGYFSPEQARGKKLLSCASDVFSLGVVMLQCLLGRHPTDYRQSELADGIKASGGRLAASASMLRILDRMLSANPSARPDPTTLSTHFQKLSERLQEELGLNATVVNAASSTADQLKLLQD
jgi:serine/threonine protein kinase